VYQDMRGALRVPITNIYAGGDYTAQISIGSPGATANVILDTGSSTLAVSDSIYAARDDTARQATALAQDVLYGTGGWTGPVVTTTIAIGLNGQNVSIDTYLALTIEHETGGFGNADGILGLAFNQLNSAYNLTTYLTQQGIDPPVTYPWPFTTGTTSSVALKQFAAFLRRMREEDLPPYFTELELQDVTKNIFAFYTLRSTVSMRTPDPASDPANNGFFILGGGPEQADLYTGEFVNVDVVDDLWYNTNLLAVQVAGSGPVEAQPLPKQYAKSYVSNSIVDSGTNRLFLAPDVYNAIMSSLNAVNPAFAQVARQASDQPVPAADLSLADWPDITFVLQGEGGQPVPLTCAPSTYWQLDMPAAGQAMFMILNGGGLQSILGLPLLNNYYTVFDRTQDAYGVIRFAPIAAP
jgi:hypothetical protein